MTALKTPAANVATSLLKDASPIIRWGTSEMNQRLDDCVFGSDLVTIGGGPKSGKTAFAISLLAENLRNAQCTPTLISVESSPTILQRRVLAATTRCHISRLSERETLREKMIMFEMVTDRPIEQVALDSPANLPALIEHMETAVDIYKSDVLIIDSISRMSMRRLPELDPSEDSGQTQGREAELTQITSTLVDFARDHNVVIIGTFDLRNEGKNWGVMDSRHCKNIVLYSAAAGFIFNPAAAAAQETARLGKRKVTAQEIINEHRNEVRPEDPQLVFEHLRMGPPFRVRIAWVPEESRFTELPDA